MDIAVCLIDSCQDSHLTQDKTLIPVAMNMNISLSLKKIKDTHLGYLNCCWDRIEVSG